MHSKGISDSAPTLIQVPLSRRSALSRIGLAGAGLLLGTGSASASSGTRIDLSGLSAEWVRVQNPQSVVAYARYIHSLRLRHITAEQVISSHAKSISSTWNSLPPKSWWNRMAYTLKIVDRIAQELRLPVTEILSAYRSEVYNRKCGGARCSWHQANMAVDVKFGTNASRVTSTARNLRDRGLFKGGIGGYGNFTHIDCRGENINW